MATKMAGAAMNPMKTEASSLVGKLEIDVDIRASARKFHHRFAGRPDHIAKATPGKVRSCDLLEGEWGKVGSIVFWNYVHGKWGGKGGEREDRGSGAGEKPDYFQGDRGDLLKEYKSFVTTIQVTPNQGGPGRTVHWHVEYEKIDEKVAHPETFMEFCVQVSNGIDEHLLNED